MNEIKRLLTQMATDLSKPFDFLKVGKTFEIEVEKTRSGTLDRAFLATKQGRLDQPPYASLRQ
jgi:hypothetical protein